MKLTGWYGYEQNPTRVGVYETMLVYRPNEFSGVRGFSLWDGKKWRGTNLSVEAAYVEKLSGWHGKMWRGVYK